LAILYCFTALQPEKLMVAIAGGWDIIAREAEQQFKKWTI